jgi:hypothetical protein
MTQVGNGGFIPHSASGGEAVRKRPHRWQRCPHPLQQYERHAVAECAIREMPGAGTARKTAFRLAYWEKTGQPVRIRPVMPYKYAG